MSSNKNSWSRIMDGVGSNFKRDWPYLIAASRINSVLSVATLFSVIAIITRLSNLEDLGAKALYVFLSAAATYLLAIAIIKLKAPAILQEFPNYSDFKAQENSHRWILWEFFYGIQALKAGFRLLPQTIFKRLSVNVNSISRSGMPTKKAFEKFAREEEIIVRNKEKKDEKYIIKLYEPVNFGRDLLIGFSTLDEEKVEKKYVLPIREDDPHLEAKSKELFWILFTDAAKENPGIRSVAWFLVKLSGFLLILSVVLAVYNVVFVDKDEVINNCCVHLIVTDV
nr:hypothetical protein [uncultured Roseibium sp.]